MGDCLRRPGGRRATGVPTVTLPVPDQLPGSRNDDDRTRRRSRPRDDLSLGSACRPGNGEAPALAVAWPRSRGWRIDETYVKVRGQWAYLYRALDKLGNTIDFYLSATRNTKAAKRFLGKALNGLKDWEQPEVLNTDKAPTYAAAVAVAEFKAEGKCPDETRHRQVKYLNNVVEADHGKLKLLLRPVRGFKTLKTAYATIKGFEIMRADRRACLRRRTVRSDRGHGAAAGPLRQVCNRADANTARARGDGHARRAHRGRPARPGWVRRARAGTGRAVKVSIRCGPQHQPCNSAP